MTQQETELLKILIRQGQTESILKIFSTRGLKNETNKFK